MPFECYCSINGKKLSVEYIPSDNDNNSGNDLMESLSQMKMTRIPQQVLFIRFPWHNSNAIQDLELFFQFYQARLTYVCFQETKSHEQRQQLRRRFNAPHDHDNNNNDDDGPQQQPPPPPQNLLLAPVMPFFHCWNNTNTNSCAIQCMTFWHPIRIGPHFQLPPKLQTLRIVMGRPRDDDLCLLLLLQDFTRLLQQQQQQHLSLKCLELEGLTIREEEEEDINNNNNNKMIIKELQGMMQVLQNHPTLEHVRFIDCHLPKALAKFLQDPPSNLQELHLITSVSNMENHHNNNNNNHHHHHHHHHDAVDASSSSSSSSSCQTILTVLARLLSSKTTNNNEASSSSTLRKLVLRNQTPTTTRRRGSTDDDNNDNTSSSWDWATTLFLEGLKHNTSLVELELQCPNLHQQDIQCLLQALEYNTTLLNLTIESSSLSSNNNNNHNDKQQQNWMSDETLSLWADYLHLISLQELHLIHDDNSNNNSNIAINHHDYNGNLFLHHNEYNNDNNHHQPLLLYGPKTIQRFANAMPGNHSLERFEIIPSYNNNNSSIFYHLNQEQQQQIQTAHNMMDYYLHLNWGRVPKLLLYGQEDHSNNSTNNHYKKSKERADDDDNNNNNVFPLPLWSRVLARSNQRQTQPQQQQQLKYTTSPADILFYFLREGPLLKEMR